MVMIQDALADEVVLQLDRLVGSAGGPSYEEFFGGLQERAPGRVTLDLSGLDRVNPQTVRMILMLWETLGRTGKVLRVRGLREDVRALFERLKIDRYIRCLP